MNNELPSGPLVEQCRLLLATLLGFGAWTGIDAAELTPPIIYDIQRRVSLDTLKFTGNQFEEIKDWQFGGFPPFTPEARGTSFLHASDFSLTFGAAMVDSGKQIIIGSTGSIEFYGDVYVATDATAMILTKGTAEISYNGSPTGMWSGYAVAHFAVEGPESNFSSDDGIYGDAKSAAIATTHELDSTPNVINGVTYHKISGSLWVRVDLYATATPGQHNDVAVNAKTSLDLTFQIQIGTPPTVELRKSDPTMPPCPGIPFQVQAIAQDTDDYGPPPQIRHYKWENAEPLPDDPSRAMATFSSGGQQTIKVTVIDNENMSATSGLEVNLTPQRIYFSVHRPDTIFGPGHSWVQLYDCQLSATRGGGFHPDHRHPLKLFGYGRALLDDSLRDDWDARLCFDVDSNTMARARDFIDTFRNNSQLYHLFDYNCTSFIEALSRHLGLPLPPSTPARLGLDVSDPRTFYESLAEIAESGGMVGNGVVQLRTDHLRRALRSGDLAGADDSFSPGAVAEALASSPSTLATTLGLPFDVQRSPVQILPAGTCILVNIPKMDRKNSLAILTWGESLDVIPQPNTSHHVYLTAGDFQLAFALVDNFRVWSTVFPIRILPPEGAQHPDIPNEVVIPIILPKWQGEIELARAGGDTLNLFIPISRDELFWQNSPELPFGPLTQWKPFGYATVVSVPLVGPMGFFRFRTMR